MSTLSQVCCFDLVCVDRIISTISVWTFPGIQSSDTTGSCQRLFLHGASLLLTVTIDALECLSTYGIFRWVFHHCSMVWEAPQSHKRLDERLK